MNALQMILIYCVIFQRIQHSLCCHQFTWLQSFGERRTQRGAKKYLQWCPNWFSVLNISNSVSFSFSKSSRIKFLRHEIKHVGHLKVYEIFKTFYLRFPHFHDTHSHSNYYLAIQCSISTLLFQNCRNFPNWTFLNLNKLQLTRCKNWVTYLNN